MIQYIAGYKFVQLENLPQLRGAFLEKCIFLSLTGTVLLSAEGINVNIAGAMESIHAFRAYLQEDSRFADMTFRESIHSEKPYKRMKVKLKKEIITMRQSNVKPGEMRAPAISPRELKRWLDEGRDITILDTRNDYEVQFGTFHRAINLRLKEFGEFPEKAKVIEKNKPVVMFCTGGIRCEKAAVQMIGNGYDQVYQLEGGILNYFADVGGDHYQGECFVFDERVALDARLQATGTRQCKVCQGPIKLSENHCCV